MIPEQAKLEIRKRRAAGGTWTGIANWIEEDFGISLHRSTIQRWHDKEVWVQDEEILSHEDSLDERIKLDKKVATYKDEAAFYKKLYQQAIKNIAKKEIIVDAIRELAPAFPPVDPAQYTIPKEGFRGKHAQTVIAPLCDTHIGESVNLEQMAQLNSYDLEIFNKRLYGWATQLLNLVNYRRNIATIDDLIMPMLGDMISGDIHEELARSNVANCMEQMIRGANLISQALMFLAPHFKTITIPCVVGNHGRMTRKPPMKDKYMDWDYLLYQWVAAFCKNQSNIKFDIPKSFINLFSVYDQTILMMHGDSISGAGSNMSIARAITSLRGVVQYKKNLRAELGQAANVDEPIHFDSAMIGHFHRIDEIDIGTGELHICGCMKGPDEFALQRLHTASKPKQLVTYWHPKYGYVGKEIIYLNRYDSLSSKFSVTVPPLWVDLVQD
jgi:hypothetical protein